LDSQAGWNIEKSSHISSVALQDRLFQDFTMATSSGIKRRSDHEMKRNTRSRKSVATATSKEESLQRKPNFARLFNDHDLAVPTTSHSVSLSQRQNKNGDSGIEQEKLQLKMDRMFGANKALNNFNNNQTLWELSDYVPEWMKEYFYWHQKERINLSEGSGHKVLVLQCLQHQDTSDKCGSLTERLTPLPLILRKAYKTKRLVLIHWTLPTKISEFLVPPEGGIDWRTPKWLERTVRSQQQSRGIFDARCRMLCL
jgi:hypothetical protein